MAKSTISCIKSVISLYPRFYSLYLMLKAAWLNPFHSPFLSFFQVSKRWRDHACVAMKWSSPFNLIGNNMYTLMLFCRENWGNFKGQR